MEQKALVTIYTQVYNTKPYLEQCISSVLAQTYGNFEYLLVDNGCTDGSSEILQDFAEKDNRIKLIRFEENQVGPRPIITKEYATGTYYTVIDSDDWWELDYLERMVNFLEKNDLDLAVTGTFCYLEKQRISQIMRKLEQPLVLTQKQLAEYYPALWIFPSTNWATLQRMAVWRKGDFVRIPIIQYGGDTMQMLHYIKLCTRIGIDNSALYHYRIHPKSITYQYNPQRFDGNVVIYEKIKEFLESHRTFDTQKQEWLKQVHLSSMTETLRLLCDAHISSERKLTECLRIRNHPLTEYVLNCECEKKSEWFSLMWEILASLCPDTDANFSLGELLVETVTLFSPECGKAFTEDDIELLYREPALWNAVKAGNVDRLSNLLLDLIIKKQFSKQYDLGAILHRIVPQGSPLRNIEDTRFFRTYALDCKEILHKNYIVALEHMTDILLGSKKLYAPEQFLDLYLSLAALENQIPAFLFGKLQLANWYLAQGKKEDCRAIANELAEMGLDNEEFSALCQKLRELEQQP